MVLKPIVHEIRIQNQVIFLDPPIEYARENWVKQFHEWLGKSQMPLFLATRLTLL
jgi:dynein heavy chain 1